MYLQKTKESGPRAVLTEEFEEVKIREGPMICWGNITTGTSDLTGDTVDVHRGPPYAYMWHLPF